VRVCLATPPFYSPVPDEPLSLPLGPAYLGAALLAAGVEVRIIDGALETVTRLSANRYLYGLSPDRLAQAILQTQPDLIGLSCPFTTRYSLFRQTVQSLRQVAPKIPIIAGGIHPTLFPQQVLEQDGVDMVVIGEGEKTLAELIRRYGELNRLEAEGLDGVVWLSDDRTTVVPKRNYVQNLDELPLPALELMPVERYLARSGGRWASRRLRSLPLLTSRACPGRCSFCSSRAVQGPIWRAHSAERVLLEIERLVKDYHPALIAFEDDRLTWQRERLMAICKGIVERRPAVRWHTPNGVHVADLDEELLIWMKKSGCASLNLAIESGDDYILHKVIGKKATRRQALDAAAACRRLGIAANGYFVVGMPGETEQSLLNTYDLCMELQLDGLGVFIATPFPGTRLFADCVKKGYIEPNSVFDKIASADDTALLNSALFETPTLKAERLIWWKQKIERDFIRQLYRRKPALKWKRAAANLARKLRVWYD